MISDLDATLKAMLTANLPKDWFSDHHKLSITFDAPTKETIKDEGLALNLFLYDVRENRELRTNEPLRERQGNTMKISRPPVRVDCSYLITAWAKEAHEPGVIDQHNILSATMIALLRYPTIPAEFLQGKLADQPAPPPVASLQAGQLQNISEYWQAIGPAKGLKAVLHYRVTISVAVDEPAEIAPLVTELVVQGPAGRTGNG